MNVPSYKEIAENFSLWAEYVDPSATMTLEDFEGMSIEEKIELQTKCFGKEEEEAEL